MTCGWKEAIGKNSLLALAIVSYALILVFCFSGNAVSAPSEKHGHGEGRPPTVANDFA